MKSKSKILELLFVKRLFAIVIGCCIVLAASAAQAGGGPENVLLLVNSNSEASKTIARAPLLGDGARFGA